MKELTSKVDNSVYISFANYVKENRIKYNMSQDSLGILCGLSQFTMSRIERAYPSHPSTREKIAAVLQGLGAPSWQNTVSE